VKKLYTDSIYTTEPTPLIKVRPSEYKFDSKRFTPAYAKIISEIIGIKIIGTNTNTNEQTLSIVDE
jgi:hypothetical protein